MSSSQVYEKLIHVFTSLSQSQKLVGTGAGLAALTIIFRFLFAKQSKLITNYSQVAQKLEEGGYDFDEFDFIIVGGGTAGCVLASRLSEDSSTRVLLIEAGGSGKTNSQVMTPVLFSKTFHSEVDYDFYTVPQVHAGNKRKFYPRGKVLGGSSAINVQMAQYGAPSDFDEWAVLTGDSSLAWKEFSRYFRRFEKYTPDPRFPHVDASERGKNGPVQLGYHSFAWPGSELFIKAAMNVGIPFSPDFTTTDGVRGVNRVMTYIDNRGQRVTTETGYLTDKVLARPNLKVITYVRATKILFKKGVDGVPRATGVDFASSPKGPRFRSRARKEVIVCGGTVHSPQLLMLSGIGPADQLEQLKVPLLVDLPDVGANLMDHPFVPYRLKEKSGKTLNYLNSYDLRTTVMATLAFLQYKLTGKGPMSTNVGETLAFFRSDDPALFPPSEFPKQIEDSTSSVNSPDIELISMSVAVTNHNTIANPEVDAYTNYIVLLRPTSVGSIRLTSVDPWAEPLIDPNGGETEHDIDVLVRGIRAGFKIAYTEPLRSIIEVDSKHPSTDHHFTHMTDAELAEVARERLEFLYHAASTCRMAPREKGGVVDTQMRVYGTQNLRVCDVSVFPKLVAGHTAGACIALAEKFADMLKVEYGLKTEATIA